MKTTAIAWVFLLFIALPARAENQSAYTDLDLAACRQGPLVADDPLESGVWWCDGYEGVPVRVGEGDLRFFVSYGENAAKETAASETLPAFNTLGRKIEWRTTFDAKSGEWRPFATILRFLTDAGEGTAKGQYLVVTKLGGAGQVCHVAVVDALANVNANELARRTADESADSSSAARTGPSVPVLRANSGSQKKNSRRRRRGPRRKRSW